MTNDKNDKALNVCDFVQFSSAKRLKIKQIGTNLTTSLLPVCIINSKDCWLQHCVLHFKVRE